FRRQIVGANPCAGAAPRQHDDEKPPPAQGARVMDLCSALHTAPRRGSEETRSSEQARHPFPRVASRVQLERFRRWEKKNSRKQGGVQIPPAASSGGIGGGRDERLGVRPRSPLRKPINQ